MSRGGLAQPHQHHTRPVSLSAAACLHDVLIVTRQPSWVRYRHCPVGRTFNTRNGVVRLIAILPAVIAAFVVACAAPPSDAPSPSAVASPAVVCDGSRFQPPPTLTCGPAILAAEAALGRAHPGIVREEFRWGDLCPPDAPCVPPTGSAGVVIFDFATGQPLFVYLSAEAGGVVASSPAPHPAGY